MRRLINKYKQIIAGLISMKLRARDTGLIKLPKKIEKGSNCSNCAYWRKTDKDGVGYCWHPEVSVFVTQRQVCNLWNADGVIDMSTGKKTALIEDFRDYPPSAQTSDIELDQNGGVKYTESADAERAKSSGLITLPKDQTGSRCYNCKYSSSVGWCKNPEVNQPINKNDCCNEWDHPGTLRQK
jgi:hypothetical protein